MSEYVIYLLQADYEFKGRYGYVVYLTILFFWEVIPTYLIVIFFRVSFPYSFYRTLAQVHNMYSDQELMYNIPCI